MAEYATIKSLPDSLRDTLKALDYGRGDIEIRTAESVTMSDSGWAGRRAFAALVNLVTGQRQTIRGSWGGQNMFDRSNPVDNDSNAYPIPPNGAIITGSHGPTSTGGTIAVIHLPASMRANVLPAPSEALTQAERDALYCHHVIVGGAYRRDELRRRNVPVETVDSLVTRGLLKRNKVGATSITTDGKNALGDYRGH